MYISSVTVCASSRPGTFSLTPLTNGNGDMIITVMRLGLGEKPVEQVGVFRLPADGNVAVTARMLHQAVEGFPGTEGDVQPFVQLLDVMRVTEF